MFKPTVHTVFFCIGVMFFVAVKTQAAAVEIESGSWGDWITQQVDKHPEIMAAKERMNAAFSMAENSEKATYNPELESEYEFYDNEEGDNYRIGLSQSIDLWDKRGARTEQAAFSRIMAKQGYRSLRQQKISQVLVALSEWRAAKQLAEFSSRQEKQLNTLLNLVDQRQRSGDLGQVDAELAFLGLSQTLNAAAQAQAVRVVSEFKVRELLFGWSPTSAQIPESFWLDNRFSVVLDKVELDALLDAHPAIVAARAEWQAQEKQAVLADREAKSDPTFGLNGGQDAGVNVVGISFSMPINIRNNYHAQVRAASQEALAAESQYRALRRQQAYSMKASAANFKQYFQRFYRWQNLNEKRAKSSGKLLQKQWRSGDFSTAEYLLALQQRADGLSAGIELRQRFEASRIEWLLDIGQLDKALKL